MGAGDEGVGWQESGFLIQEISLGFDFDVGSGFSNGESRLLLNGCLKVGLSFGSSLVHKVDSYSLRNLRWVINFEMGIRFWRRE
jgi:hypothetical protein